MLQLRQELADLELSMQGVYGHTADARAERSMLLWYTIQLCKVVEEGEEKSFFDGLLYEDQLENLYEKDEEGTLVEKEALQNFMAAISYWFYNNSADQEAVEKFIESSKKNA